MNVNQRKTTNFQYVILKLPTPSTSSVGEAPEAVPSFLLLFHSSERTDTSGETGAAACAIITWPTIDTLHYAVNWAFTPLPLSRTLSVCYNRIGPTYFASKPINNEKLHTMRLPTATLPSLFLCTMFLEWPYFLLFFLCFLS